jgi:hypothetical protein
MSQLGQHYINEHDELGILVDYEGDDVAEVSWFRKDRDGKTKLSRKELRYLPYLTPIDKAVADIMLGLND